MQVGTQANQFASTINRAGNITNFTENRANSISTIFMEDICNIILQSFESFHPQTFFFLFNPSISFSEQDFLISD